MQPGIYDNITNEQYHSGPGVSKSLLDYIASSPAKYKMLMDGEIEKRQTKFFDLGKALHVYCLEPKEFTKYYSRPLNRETIERSGVKIVPDEREKIEAMVESVNADRLKSLDGMVTSADDLIQLIIEENKTRKPKLATTGSKSDLITRIMAEFPDGDAGYEQNLQSMKGAELKAQIEAMNADRHGLIPTSGSKSEILARVRDELGFDVQASWEYVAMWEAENGHSHTMSVSGATRPQMIDWLNHAKYQGGNWRTWQQVLDEWTVNNPGRTILDNDTWDKLNKMRDSVMNHQKASKLLWDERGGVAEQSIYWIDEETGELCRCRPDWNPKWINVLVDLKTTADASPEGFAKSVANFRYDVQEQFYLDGVEAATGKRPDKMVFIAVETEAPYNCAVYVLGPEFAQIGRGKYRENLRTLHECKEKNSWPGYSEKIETLNPAGWYAQRNAHFLDNGNW